MISIKKIIMPTDFSEPSLAAIKPALQLAQHFSAKIIVVHVVSPVPMIPGMTTPPAVSGLQLLKDMQAASENAIEKLVKERMAGVKVGYFVLQGKPADEIVNVSGNESADLIIMSTHGESGLQRLVLGSVAGKVVRLADCPVLTVKNAQSS